MRRLFLLSSFALGFSPAAIRESLRWDAATLFEKSLCEHVSLSTDGRALEPESGELYEDDGPAAGFSYKPNEEPLSDGVRIRKVLVVPNPRARSATLLVGPGGAILAEINGKAQRLEPAGKAGQYWQAYRFDPQALREGANDFVLWGSGKVWISRYDEFPPGTPPPRRSARSLDGGKSWDAERPGEYAVRLFLDHPRPRGSVTLPILDLANLQERPVGPAVASIGPVRISADSEGKVAIRSRTGPLPLPGKGWTDWREGGTIEKPAGRYVQVSAVLSASDPRFTPRLKSVALEASVDLTGDWTRPLGIAEWRNETIVRSSIPFEYEPFTHPRLRELRERHALDEVVKGATGDLEILSRLARWSAGRWSEGHLKEAYPPWDAIEILKPHRDGKPVGGFCQQYNLVFLQACESLGFAGRAVSIGPGGPGTPIRGGHEVAEIWSNDHRGWVYIDGQAAWYAVDAATGRPLSLLELRSRQLPALRGEPFPPIRVVEIAPTRHAWKGLDDWPPFVELRLIPRSNFLEKPSPLPLNQGMRGWFWTGHHAWTDAAAPASLLYGHRVTRRGDFEWTLNQVRLVLEAAPAPREIRVHLDTETPGFETYLAEIDGGEKTPVSSGFLWKLHRGRNRLDVRPRNVAGREGIASRVVLEVP